jgi:hypothetical protein
VELSGLEWTAGAQQCGPATQPMSFFVTCLAVRSQFCCQRRCCNGGLGAGCRCRPRRALLQRTMPRTLPDDIRGSARTAIVSLCVQLRQPRRRTWRALVRAGVCRRGRGRVLWSLWSGTERVAGFCSSLMLDVIEGDSILALRVAHSAQPERYEHLARAPLLDSGSVAEAWGRAFDSASCAGHGCDVSCERWHLAIATWWVGG